MAQGSQLIVHPVTLETIALKAPLIPQIVLMVHIARQQVQQPQPTA
jgi:hypothetical protein